MARGSPIFELDTERLGPIRVTDLRAGDLIDLSKADPSLTMDARAFVSEMIRVLAEREDGTPLTDHDVEQLTPSEREAVVRALVSEDGSFFTEGVFTTEKDPDGRDVSRQTGTRLVLPREDGETDEDYLLRGWRRYAGELRERYSRFSSSFAKLAGTSLLANTAASVQLSKTLAAIGKDRPSLNIIKDTTRPDILSLIPESPAIKANQLLEEMAKHLAETKAMAENSARMQSTLNDIALNILDRFQQGAAASERSTRWALGIAVSSMVLTLIAVVTSIIVAALQANHSMGREASDDKAQTQALSLARANVDAVNHLATVLQAKPPSVPPAAAPGKPKGGAMAHHQGASSSAG